jgi:hypothetical protein
MEVVTRVIDHQGCRLAYDVRGSGPRVLFIQGVGVHAAMASCRRSIRLPLVTHVFRSTTAA